MPVPVGESITIGTFGNRDAHSGIWYNIEGYTNPPSTSYGLVTALTVSQLTTFNQTINANDTWSLNYNCSGFARDVWNSIAPSGYTLTGSNPATLATSIKAKSSYVTNTSIPTKLIGTIARHTSSSYIYDSSGATPN